MRRILAGMVTLSLIGFGAGLASEGGEEPATKPAEQQRMDPNVKVGIGDSGSSAKGVVWHDITTEALIEGRREYEVRSEKKTYKINLTKNQLDMVLEGTRVAVPTTEGDKKVVIFLKKRPKPKKK